MTRFRLPAQARAALALAGAAALSLGLLGTPAASAATSRVQAPADQPPITVSLTASRADGLNPLHPVPGQTITLTATASIDVAPTPYYIEIYNYFGTYLLKACGGGTTCSVDVTENSPIAAGQIAFVAYVAYYSDWLFPPGVQADTTASPIEPSWLYPLTATAHRFGAAGITIDFTDGGATTWAPWYLQIYDASTNQIVAYCAKPSGCTAVVPGWEGDYPNPYDSGCQCGYVTTGDGRYSSDTFWVYLAQYSGNWPPPDIRDWTDHAA